MAEGLLVYALLCWLCGVFVGVILSVFVVYINGEALIHYIRYKTYVLPCPACRDEETDKPTGKLKPKSGELQARLRRAGGKAEPEFDCHTCDGSMEISYKFPRHERVEINKRQMLESEAPGQPKPGKKGWFR